jgi:hypothetical protein
VTGGPVVDVLDVVVAIVVVVVVVMVVVDVDVVVDDEDEGTGAVLTFPDPHPATNMATTPPMAIRRITPSTLTRSTNPRSLEGRRG